MDDLTRALTLQPTLLQSKVKDTSLLSMYNAVNNLISEVSRLKILNIEEQQNCPI